MSSEPVTRIGSLVDDTTTTSASTSTTAAASVVGSPLSGTLTLIALPEGGSEGGVVTTLPGGEANSANMRTSSSTSTSTSTSSSSSSSSAGELEAESDAPLILGSVSSTASTAATTVSSVSISSLKGIEIEAEGGIDIPVEKDVDEEEKWEEKIADAMDTSVFGSLLEVTPLISSSLSPSSPSPSHSSLALSTHSTSSTSTSSSSLTSIPIIGTPLDISLSPLVEHIFAIYAAEYAEMEMLREEEESAYRKSLEVAEEREREREKIRALRVKKQRGVGGVWSWLRPSPIDQVSCFH